MPQGNKCRTDSQSSRMHATHEIRPIHIVIPSSVACTIRMFNFTKFKDKRLVERVAKGNVIRSWTVLAFRGGVAG
jgi:hypothetical protein